MNTDIRISTSFLNHRKRKKLAQILGPGSTDYLIDLWINTAINRPKGVLYDMDKTDIALDAGWDGNAGQFVDSLLEVGFLDYNGEWFKVHDWDKHQSYAVHAEARSERARKAASKRWEYIKQCPEDANSMPVAQPEHAQGNAPSPTPSPDPTPKPKKEKTTPFRAIDFLVNLGIKKQTGQDFLKNRKAKRLANTLTSFETIQREIEKTKLSPQDVILKCCEEGWGGFKAEWLNGKAKQGQGDQRQLNKEKALLEGK